MKNQSEVKEFFKGKTVLLTGTTGFVGKVLLERLMSSCTDVKRIYLMVRPKANMTLQQRIQD
jgi:fatty acyl-CoA reductase